MMGYIRAPVWTYALLRPLATGASVTILLTGCASQHGTVAERTLTNHQPITLRSPAVLSTGVISSRFRCAKQIWLPLSWNHLPPNTAELVLYIGGYGPRQITAHGTILDPIVAGVIVAGLKPGIHSLKVGALPATAIGVTAANTPACPPRVHGGQFIIRVFALPYRDRISRATLSSEEPLQLLENIAAKASSIGNLSARYG